MSLDHFQDVNASILHAYEKRWADYEKQIMYLTIGLTGEAGECAEKVKKWARNEKELLWLKKELRDELGDLLWYMVRLASHLDLTLEEIADANLKKLADRRERGVITSEGDHR
jgi:NTP pyrophosphatase (non-canonical NTP hydrolase)